jgi:hypothetical protein
MENEKAEICHAAVFEAEFGVDETLIGPAQSALSCSMGLQVLGNAPNDFG